MLHCTSPIDGDMSTHVKSRQWLLTLCWSLLEGLSLKAPSRLDVFCGPWSDVHKAYLISVGSNQIFVKDHELSWSIIRSFDISWFLCRQNSLKPRSISQRTLEEKVGQIRPQAQQIAAMLDDSEVIWMSSQIPAMPFKLSLFGATRARYLELSCSAVWAMAPRGTKGNPCQEKFRT